MREASSTQSRFTVPLRVFLVGCVLSLLGGLGLHQWIRLSAVMHVEEEAANVEGKLEARMSANLALLRGAAAFFGSEAWVSRSSFHRYFNQVEVAQHYQGVQGFGLSVRVNAADVPSLLARARADGWPQFHLWPSDQRDEYHAILYLAPEDERNRVAIGYDMHTEPVRRLAMDRARDTGQAAITGRVTLVQEINAQKQAGFLVYAPFYLRGERPTTEAERREQLAGYAYAAFRAGDFIASLVQATNSRRVAIALYAAPDASEEQLLINTAPDASVTARRDAVVRRRLVRILDQDWLLVCSTVPNATVSPLVVAVLGLIISAGIAVLFRGVEQATSRAEKSEAATRARESELALLVDAVPALVAYIDRDSRLRFCNRLYAEWFPALGSGVVGEQVAAVVGPEAFVAMEPFIRRALEGESVAFDRWYRTQRFGSRYLGTIFVPHRAENGQIVGLYALSSDLTGHRRAEEAARFVADCGKLVFASMDFESTSRGIVHLAVPRIADMAILFRANEGKLKAVAIAHTDGDAERTLNAAADELEGRFQEMPNLGEAIRSGRVVVVPEMSPAVLHQAVPTERHRELIEAMQFRSAMHVPVIVRGRLWAVFTFVTSARSDVAFTDEHRQLGDEISTRVRLAVENALLYREAQQELEDRRRAERVAHEAEERFRLLVEGVRDYAIMALDAEGRIESWNEGAQRTLGYGDKEAIGRDPGFLFLPEDVAAGIPLSGLARARERGAASEERWFLRKDGARFWASSHLVVLRENGAIRGFAWILRDLTDRKRMEEELERRVQARTTELNEAVQELEAFSYSVSHDLRAPLRAIRGFTELAIEEATPRLTEDERNYLERVHRASGRLERLISDLLAYTRVSKTRVELRRVELHALVSDIVREHPEFQLPAADVKIEGMLLPAIGNEVYLTQCITNLLGNAVKFVPEGRLPVVRVWTERHEKRARLLVRDNGIGIAPQQLSRAFEVFERLHTSGNYEGTGIGLAIVRRAVQRMNGRVGVESTLGQGTTFWIELASVD